MPSPPRPVQAVDLGRALVRERGLLAVKCAVAAAAAWLLARAVTGTDTPYYAPLVAFLMIQPTVSASLRDSAQYLGAAGLGVLVALASASLPGPTVLRLAVALSVAVLLGGLRWLGEERVTVSFWALFTLVVGGADPQGYVLQRLPDAGLGAVVGLLVNLLVVPPLLVQPADVRLAGLRAELVEALRAMAARVTAEWPPQDEPSGRVVGEALVADVRTAVAEAGESLRMNPRGRRRWQRAQEQRRELEQLEEAALAVRALERLLRAAALREELELSDDVRPLLAEHLARAAEEVQGTGRQEDALPRLRLQVAALGHQEPDSWLTEGAAVVHLEQVLRAAARLRQG